MTDWQVELYDVDEYLAAVGLDRAAPSLDYLTRLTEAHVRTFPFANIDVLLGRHPGVDPGSVATQLLRRRTGGYCLEHSQLLAGVLEQLGFTVQRRFGRARAVNNPRAHLTVVVTLDGVDYLCDPGFGYSIRHPLPLRDGASVDQGGRRFTLRLAGDGPARVGELYRDGEFQHLIDALPVLPIDVATCHAFLGLGFGPFTTSLMVMRHTADGHVTVTHNLRTVRNDDEKTVQEPLTPEQVLAGVRELGVELDDGRASALLAQVEHLQAGSANSSAP